MRSLLLSLMILSAILGTRNVQAWELQPIGEGTEVNIWTQKVADSEFKAFKGQVFINAPLAEVLTVIRDTQNIPKWYHNTSEARKLERISPNQSLSYSVADAPWPVMDRDSVTFVTQTQLANGEVHIDLQARPNAYPKQPERIRIPKLAGFWHLKPLQANRTEVIFQIAAEPGGQIPSWLANSMVIDMPFYTLLNLKNRVEKN